MRLKDDILKEALIENEKDSKPLDKQLYREIVKTYQQTSTQDKS